MTFGDINNYMTFGDGNGYMTFGDCNSYMTFGSSGLKATFTNGIQGTEETSLDLSSSTILTGDYNKTYTTAADGAVVVVYIDASNAQVISETL